jgi:putative membrane protein
MMMDHMGYYMGEYGWGWMLLGALHMIVFWALVIVAIWLLVRPGGGGDGKSRSRSRALEILDERYARGEIEKSEYEQRRADLMR